MRQLEKRQAVEMNDIENLPVRNAHHLRSEDAGKLPLLLKNMLEIAEEWFGPRDGSFSVTGIVFRKGCPTIHFPKWYEGKEIEIYLQIDPSEKEEKAMSRARYQLAHESVHLLSPILSEESTYFEEGVACYFAEQYVKTVWNDCWRPGDLKYQAALRLVISLFKEELAHETQRRYGIKNLRRCEDAWRKFGDISHEEIVEAYPNVGQEDAHLLTSPFQHNEGLSVSGQK